MVCPWRMILYITLLIAYQWVIYVHECTYNDGDRCDPHPHGQIVAPEDDVPLAQHHLDVSHEVPDA